MPTSPSRVSSSLPAWPTNGRPCLSSWKPGASPTNIRDERGFPRPTTTWVRVEARAHCWQSRHSADNRSSSCIRLTGSRSITPAHSRTTGGQTGASRSAPAQLRGQAPPPAGTPGPVDGVARSLVLRRLVRLLLLQVALVAAQTAGEHQCPQPQLPPQHPPPPPTVTPSGREVAKDESSRVTAVSPQPGQLTASASLAETSSSNVSEQ